MASAKLSPTDRPTAKLLNKIADYIDVDCVGSIANDLDMKDSKLSQIQADSPGNAQNQVFRVLKWWEENTPDMSTQIVINKLWEWKKKGYVDIDVMDNIQGMVDIDLQTSRSNKILSNKNLRELSERITSENDLMELGIKMLNVPERKLELALSNHPRSIQAAVHEVLRFWLRQQTNREVAYTLLFQALWDNKWKMHASDLKKWVEG